MQLSYQKVFETVLHRKLLVKLEKIWISRRIVRWKKMKDHVEKRNTKLKGSN